MIEPLFFPFTHLSEQQIQAVSALFQSFSFLPISLETEFNDQYKQQMTQKNIRPFYPGNDELKPVINKAQEYLEWTKYNLGNEKNFKMLLKSKPYFTSDTSVTSLKSELSKTRTAGSTKAETNPPLFEQMLFLRIAQIADSQKEIAHKSFGKLKKNENELFSRLQGMESPSLDKFDPKDLEEDPGEYMTRERVNAWFKYVNKKEFAKKTGKNLLFVTTSDSVLEYLVSISEKSVNALDIDNIKVHENKCAFKSKWQKEFNLFLENVLCGGNGPNVNLPQTDDACSIVARVKLFLLSGNAIDNILQNNDGHVPIFLVQLKN